MSELRKNDTVTLSITDLNNLGCGVGRLDDGRVVFVKGAVSGDVVLAKLIKINKSFCVARLERLIEASPYRISEDICSAPLACGGCVYRHITYEHELVLKREYVENAFRKTGLFEVSVSDVRSTGKLCAYRNKAQYPVTQTKDGVRAGFFASKSHNIIPADSCAIQNENFAPIVAFICSFADSHGWSVYDEESCRGLLRHIYMRIGEKTGQIMVCLVINGDTLPCADEFARELTRSFPLAVSVMLNINRESTNVVLGKKFVTLWGKTYIEDELCGVRFRISPESFYQVNRDGAELLYSLAAERAELRGDEVLMDLYCGTGTIGLTMAHRAHKLCGVEIVAGAVECARQNAAANGIDNARFFCADAGDPEVILKAAGGARPDVVILDPPRKGSTRELVECLASLSIPRIVYISCNPDTLARDCAWFSEVGYTLSEVTPVDLFPRTGHVESVVCLCKQ